MSKAMISSRLTHGLVGHFVRGGPAAASLLRRFSSSGAPPRLSWFARARSQPAVLTGLAAGALSVAYYLYQHNDKVSAKHPFSGDDTEQSVLHKSLQTVLWPFRKVKGVVGDAFNEVVSDFTDPSSEILLPPAPPDAFGNTPRTLVLDVEGTLVFNEYERGVGWRPVKRPYADLFLLRMFQAGYEICAFTSGHQAVVDPILSQLDRHRVISHRLYRDATTYRNGVHMKDLSKLNRDLSKVIIVDDEPEAFSMHPSNGITIKKFDGDPQDVTLLQLIPVLESMIADDVADVREVLRQYPGIDGIQKFTEERVARMKALRDQHILSKKKSDNSGGNAIKSLASWFGISSNKSRQ